MRLHVGQIPRRHRFQRLPVSLTLEAKRFSVLLSCEARRSRALPARLRKIRYLNQNGWMQGLTLIGRVDARNDQRVFGIKEADRFAHIHVIGKTGTGKSTLLENMARQDLLQGRGTIVIDPHGDMVDRLYRSLSEEARSRTTYVDIADRSQPYGYNPLRHVGEKYAAIAASGLMDVFRKRWTDAWGVRMEHILRNTLLALLELPNATLADVPRLYSDKAFRRSVTAGTRNPAVRAFFEQEFDRLANTYRSDGLAPIQNKVGAFLADPLIRRFVTEPKSDLHFRREMDAGRSILINLSKGRLGEDSSSLLGGLIVTTIGLAAASRAEAAEAERRPSFIYIDEFQSFTTLAVVEMLTEMRKYAVGFTMAHQYLHQLALEVRHAILGNAGTLIAFRLGAEDAEIVSRELDRIFSPSDLLRLANRAMALRLMIDGQPSRPFSARTI